MTDISDRGVGVVLNQEDLVGVERQVAYFLEKLLPRKTRYSSIRKECLAIVQGMKHVAV